MFAPSRIATLILALAAIGFGCATPDLEAELPSQSQIENYLKSATHLNEAQQRAMREHRPFIGMTPQEADLAMLKQSVEMSLGSETLHGIYLGRKGIRYHLYFQGDPPVLVDWGYFSADDIELTDPDKLRPQPRGIP